jgi:hypothetical protein
MSTAASYWAEVLSSHDIFGRGGEQATRECSGQVAREVNAALREATLHTSSSGPVAIAPRPPLKLRPAAR